ncbi:MAG: methyltransferase domain-containing protein [Flavobacteriales bacterium]|nr:methyltransferase domain-containing protein [Flavobacteriales bacterium]
MFRTVLIFLLLLSQIQSNSQNFAEFSVDNLPDSLITHEARLKLFIQILETDTVADIGAGKMDYSLHYANLFNQTTFYFEDIDSIYCNWIELQKTIKERNFSNVDTNKISIVIGNENSTTLPTNSCDVVILQSTLHLIAENQKMIHDMQRILKPNGCLLIIEKFTENKNKVHPNCSTPYMTYIEMDKFMADHELIISKDWKIIYEKNNGYSFNYIQRYIECSFKK